MMNSESLDPRVIRSRQMLQDALLSLMDVKPFQAITVRDITRTATLNRATFYLHYTDKFDLLNQTARDRFHEMLRDKLPPRSPQQINDLKAVVTVTCDFLQNFMGSCSPSNKPFEPMIESQIQQQLYQYLLTWLNSNVLRGAELTSCDETTATVVSWAILGACLRWLREDTGKSPQEIADELFVLVMDGLWQIKPEPV